MAAKARSARELCEALGLRPRNLEIYEQALVHRSLLNERGQDLASNERLEFLGDSVLGLAVARFLYESFPELSEGQLARRKSQLVSTATLALWSRELGLGSCLRLGKGEEQTGGRDKDTLLADVFEAWLGAVYMDLGFRQAEAFVAARLKEGASAGAQPDSKSRLQELTQKLYKRAPEYRVAGTRGPDHDKTFEVEVYVEGRLVARGRGRNKKEAEQAGAQEALRAAEGKAKGRD